MEVLVASNGAAALQALALVKPDLVLMDAVMPVMDGFETTRRIKADPILSSIPVIFMTGLTETEHVVRGLGAGGVDYVRKPIIIEEMLARIAVHTGNAAVARSSRAALDTAGRSVLAVNSAGSVLWATPRGQAIVRFSTRKVTSISKDVSMPVPVISPSPWRACPSPRIRWACGR
jgi:DNA-binding response OmpR family regulator